MDFVAAIDAVRRELLDTTHDGKPARTIVAERRYPTSAVRYSPSEDSS